MAEPSGHAKLSPSAAKRWLTCPASVEASAHVVSEDNEHSLRGTAGHWARAEWLTKGEPPPAGTKAPNGVEITQEIIDAVGMSVGWVRSYMTEHTPSSLLVEEKVPIGSVFGVPDDVLWGTADGVIMAAHELVIEDLKLGWVDVPVEGNKQLLLYAGGMMNLLSWIWPQVRLVITQPKNGGVKEWVISADALAAALEEMKPGVHLALSENPPYVPSEEKEVCGFCPVSGVCRAFQSHALELARQEFSTPAALVDHLTLDELRLLLTKAEMVEGAIAAVRAHAKKLLDLGTEIPGWKLVEGRKNRVWKSEAEAEKTLLALAGDSIYTKKLVSPAQAEKLVKKDVVETLSEKPKGEPMLAPESDKRPALSPSFGVVDVGNLLD